MKKATIPNPALEPLSVLVGKWKTVGSHPLAPDLTLHGRTTFEWIEGGAFLRMHSEVDDPRFPTGIAIVGSDNESKRMYMLYFDSRAVSRKYDFSIDGNQWKWWRDHPGFSQRFSVDIAENGNKMVGKGELCRDNSTWEDDLDLIYTRLT